MGLLSYAGVYLPVPPADLLARVSNNLTTRDVYDFSRRLWPGPGLAWTAFPGQRRARPVKPNTLYWPVGASRFAVGYFFATDNQLARIRQQVAASGDSTNYSAQTLVLDDGKRPVVSTSMFMLPPRPLEGIPGANGLYLLTLVDDRYFWWERTADIQVASDGSTTWASLISSIATGLSITLTTDAINANYLTPSSTLTSLFEQLPILLDAVLYNVGMRLVRKLDGTTVGQLATTAMTSVNANLAQNWPKRAGGQFLMDPGVTPNDLTAVAPKNVQISFPKTNSGVPAGDSYAVTQTLSTLALPEYAGVTGHTGTKTWHSGFIATFTGGGTPTNLTTLQSLVNQTGTDFYRWQLGKLDELFIGCEAWVPEGYHDLEWSYRGFDVPDLRVQRAAWMDLAEELSHWNGTGTFSVVIGGPTFFYSTVTYNNPSNFYYYSTYGSTVATLVNPTYNDYNPGNLPKLELIAASGGSTITGFTGGVDGRQLIVMNIGITDKIILANSNVGSAFNNRIDTPLGTTLAGALADYTLWPGDAVILEYQGNPNNAISATNLRHWQFDVPTIGAGTGTLQTYAIRQLKFKTGLSYTDNNDGSADVNVVFPAATTAKYETYFRHVGTTRWYLGGEPTGAVGDTSNPVAANTLYALPFLATRGGTLDQIGYYSRGGGGGNARLGIYNNISDTNLAPGTLLKDGGSLVNPVGAALTTATINQALTAFTLYWIVAVFDAGLTISLVNGGNCWTILGTPAGPFDSSRGIGYSAPFTFNVLPADWTALTPVILSSTTSVVPAMGVRFSA